MAIKTKRSNHQSKLLLEVVLHKKWLYLFSILSLALASFFAFLVPYIGKLCIDYFVAADGTQLPSWLLVVSTPLDGILGLQSKLWLFAMAVVVVTLLSGSFMYLKDYWAALACEGTVRQLRNRLYSHLHLLPAQTLSQADSGDLLQRCTSDIDTLREFLTMQVMNIGRTGILLLVVVPMMWWQSPSMTLLSLVLVPVVITFAWHFFERVRALFQEVDEAEGELTTVVQENLTGIRVVRAFARQTYENEKFDVANRRYSDLNYQLIAMLAKFWSTSDLLCLSQTGIVLIGGGWLASQGYISVGTFFAFLTYSGMVIWPIRELGKELSEAGKATVAIGRIQEILSLEEEQDKEDAAELEQCLGGDIAFDQVSFSYDGEQSAIRQVSFNIKAGQTVAIVGPTGAGKSTLIKLLMRLRDCSEGEIRLDGHPITDFSRRSVRAQIGTLLQEPFLFSRSLRDNIKFGRREASDDEMIASSRAAAVHRTIERFDKGYDTVIGERGVSLSGGQAQRVTLSRTLLKQPPILVLDDTLSAVDAHTEQEIIRALNRQQGRQTSLIITHRISVCQHADHVLVMQRGCLTAQGSHAELLRQEGFYRQLWAIQSGQQADFEQLTA